MKYLPTIIVTIVIMILVAFTMDSHANKVMEETVRAAVVLNEARLEKRYFDLENRFTNLENRVFNLECPKVKGCIKK